jgi:hypothetical protein
MGNMIIIGDLPLLLGSPLKALVLFASSFIATTGGRSGHATTGAADSAAWSPNCDGVFCGGGDSSAGAEVTLPALSVVEVTAGALFGLTASTLTSDEAESTSPELSDIGVLSAVGIDLDGANTEWWPGARKYQHLR